MYRLALSLILLAFCFQLATAQQTEIKYLSGTGNDDGVLWDFFCTKGMNSGKWTKIRVPSCWETEGFGSYNYGNDRNKADEEGLYRCSFAVPAQWSGKHVFIVFDGSMTDTEVKINGKTAGPVHQGAFYRFRYDITGMLKFGRKNLLEAKVSKMSANATVNEAERTADFWVFGGIFRPVWLQAFPKEYIDRIAIDARADGTFTVDAFPGNPQPGREISVRIIDKGGNPAGGTFTARIDNPESVRVSGSLPSPETWTPEFPNLYTMEVSLGEGTHLLHRITEKFGFRTLELRERDGFYVNGQKIRFKGINHHSFWPTSGRTTSRKISVDDVKLIREMNMNAVRMSHYPPDAHYLDVCDSLGLFVLDELTAWQYPPYDTEVGKKLVREMVIRDVNHPCVVIWDNGNEGGFNFDLVPEFGKYDPQKRIVIHPWMKYRGTDTQHYPVYGYGMSTYFNGRDVFFPTEFSHGLYDGGHGATLDDFWNLMVSNPLSAGGFLWDFCDQGVVRTDKNGILDTGGNQGADGIMGPYREKEASFYTVKEIWSPVFIEKKYITPAFDGVFNIENRYHFTNLRQCSFAYELKRFPDFQHAENLKGNIPSPEVAPAQKGTLKVPLPAGWLQYDALYITATDPHGKEIFTWSWNITSPGTLAERWVTKEGQQPASVSETADNYHLSANGVEIEIDRKNGQVARVSSHGKDVPFGEGPVLIDGDCTPKEVRASKTGEMQTVEVTFSGKHKFNVRYILYPSGWLELDYSYRQSGSWPLMGITFTFPEKIVKGAQLLANGPYRVWKNRLKGGTFNLWDKKYNNTVTGESWDYPEFKGYYSGFYGVRILAEGTPFTVLSGTEDLYLHLFTPDPPRGASNSNTSPVFPKGNLSFLHGISPIGTKFQNPEVMGPQGGKNLYMPNPNQPDLSGKLFFYFR
jgi:hypothetical protein